MLSSPEILIRQAVEADIENLVDIGAMTFFEAFSEGNNPADMALYLAENYNIEKVRKDFTDKNIVYIVAIIDEEIIAYSKLRLHHAEGGLDPSRSAEIERVYVMKLFQGMGAGEALMDYMVKHAMEKGFETIWLGVWEHNIKAMNLYSKWGFEVFGSHIFMLGTDAQNDLLMKKELKDSSSLR